MPRHPFYNTRTWKHLRKVKLVTDPLCERCKVKPATDVDHIKAINAGGNPTAFENLRSLCHECHSQKTYYIDRLKRDRVPVKGCDINGRPLDPQHHWNSTGQDKGQGEIVHPDAFKREKKFGVSEAEDRAGVETQS
jgi:5-methylcytosine-specific restriction protein A